MRAGISGNAIRNFLSGRSSSMTDRSLQELANAENVSVAEMMSDNGAPPEKDHKLNNISSQPAPSVSPDTALSGDSEVRYPDQPIELPPLSSMPKDVPVWGTAGGNNKGEFQLSAGEAIDTVRRLPGISGARDVYALYVVGMSMYPRFEEGELVYVHPHRPTPIGSYVVVQMQDEDDSVRGEIRSMVKKLVRRTATKLVFEQFNPPGTTEVAISEVKEVHLVLTTNELGGV